MRSCRAIFSTFSFDILLQIQDDDYCAENQDYVDVIARNLEPIPSYIIDIMKLQLSSTCFEPGEIVSSPHTGQSGLDFQSNKILNFKTMNS